MPAFNPFSPTLLASLVLIDCVQGGQLVKKHSLRAHTRFPPQRILKQHKKAHCLSHTTKSCCLNYLLLFLFSVTRCIESFFKGKSSSLTPLSQKPKLCENSRPYFAPTEPSREIALLRRGERRVFAVGGN